MDPASTALHLIKAVCTKAENVRTNGEDCKLLARLAEQMKPLLTYLSNYSVSDPGIVAGLTCMIEALEIADTAITECDNASAFVAVVNSSKIADNLRMASSTLAQALSLLSVANIGITAGLQEDLHNLQDQLKNAQFNQTAASRRQMSALKDQLERGFNRSAQNADEIRSLILQLLQEHSESLVARTEDLELLKAYLADARTKKEKLEEFELQQIIDAIEEGMRASPVGDSQENASCEAFHSHLMCPITKELMTDPVIVLEWAAPMTSRASSSGSQKDIEQIP